MNKERTNVIDRGLLEIYMKNNSFLKTFSFSDGNCGVNQIQWL